MTNRSRAFVTALALPAFFGLVAFAHAFECPNPQPQGGAGVIKETPAQIAELAPVLAGGNIGDEIPKVVDALRKRYPGAGAAEIANYIITAYCPSVAKTAGLSDAEKTIHMQAFSKTVLAVLY